LKVATKDIQEAADTFTATFEKVAPANAEASRAEKSEQGKHRRRIQFWLFILTAVVVLVALGFAGNALLNGGPEEKKLAWNAVTIVTTSLVSGLAGFAIGKKAE
jgi:heme/copper-type cytochrome/quinol oxidase subunit 3